MAPKKIACKRSAAASHAPTAPAAVSAAAQQDAPPSNVPLISVRYSSEPLSFCHHFGHEGGADLNVIFSSRLQLPLFRDRTSGRGELITQGSSPTIRAIVTDAVFENSERKVLKKPAFLYGDSVDMEVSTMYDGNYKWLREVDGHRLFLPNMERMFPLSYYQTASVPRSMGWDLVREQGGVAVGQLTYQGVHPAGFNRQLATLKPGIVQKDYPAGEAPKLANTFARKFLSKKGEFPAQGFRTPGWVHSPSTGWWTRMVNFVMEELRGLLMESGLDVPVLATRHGIVQNHFGFLAMLELYNPDTCTFFTPIGELGFALHEMYEISGLTIGELPYEEFIPGTEELTILKKTSPEIYDTYWELMCHFHICAQVTGLRGGGVKQGSWADYLFQNLNNKEMEVIRLPPSTSEEIDVRIGAATAHYVNEGLEDKFPAQCEFDSFHYQAQTPISDRALFAGFLMLWLKRCVVPTRPIESIAAEVIYPAVLLAYGRPLNLLAATVSCMQSGLRELSSEFTKVKEKVSEGLMTVETPCPRVPLPYTYLVSWFVLHCPSLMCVPADDNNAPVPLVHRLESAQWASWYLVFFRQTLSRDYNYTIFRCFPNFEGGAYGTTHQDTKGTNSFTTLNEGAFRWLLNIRPGYLVFRQGRKCFIEPYQPYRFARQFGYDQLYVGNPNPKLAKTGNLYEGARAWYYSVAGCTGAVFRLPHKTPNSYTSLAFCTWFYAASRFPEYRIYSSFLKQIRKMYDSKRAARKTSRLRGFEEFLSSEKDAIAEEGSAAPAPIEQEPVAITAKAKEAAGKRALTAEEADRYEKQAKRRLIMDPPAQDEQGSKLMESAFRSAPPVLPLEEEPQESSVGGISHQVGLRSMGPALAGEVSSYHPPDEEGGDESGMGDAESAPTAVPDAQAPVKDSAGVEEELIGESTSSLELLPIPTASGVSPTTGLLPQPVASESPEKVDYEASEEDEGDEEDGADGDDEDDEINEAWDTLPVSSPGKASSYTPISLPGKC